MLIAKPESQPILMTPSAQDPASLPSGLEPDTLFAPFSEASGLLVAVSGGPDSMALLALAADWSKGARRPPVIAATLDHGFRSASADEARMVGTVCAKLGLAHTILGWTGAKPVTRIQERARAARYAALCGYARQAGASILLTAHHADDQAETILFRMLRGSGIGGLAGMQATRARDEIIHARPLLPFRKTDLVAFCEARALPFVKDPSNSDPRYARTRMRTLAAHLESAGMGPAQWARLSGRAASAEEALVFATGQLRASLDIQVAPDRTSFDASVFSGVPRELVLRLLIAEIIRIGRPPRLERAEPLVDLLLRRVADGVALRATLGGVILDLRKDRRLSMTAEGPRGKAS
ncbi:MAG: tRNA(Ile)-lysidine synthetase [Hyphomicrobiales bacterium]|nr:tRNA(Ile)-lysidine synthetase [Hyphomicrobiales bacterium]